MTEKFRSNLEAPRILIEEKGFTPILPALRGVINANRTTATRRKIKTPTVELGWVKVEARKVVDANANKD